MTPPAPADPPLLPVLVLDRATAEVILDAWYACGDEGCRGPLDRFSAAHALAERRLLTAIRAAHPDLPAKFPGVWPPAHQ